MDLEFDTWQHGIRRASCRVFATFCLVLAALQSRVLLTGAFELRSTGVTAIGVGVTLTAAYRGWRTRLNGKDAWAFTLLLVVAAADPYLMHSDAGTGGDENPAFFILAATFLVYVVTMRGPAVPASIAAATAVYVTASVVSGGRLLAPVLDESVILATSQLSVWILVRQLVTEAVRADEAHRPCVAWQSRCGGGRRGGD